MVPGPGSILRMSIHPIDPPELTPQDRQVAECQASGEYFFVLRGSDIFSTQALAAYIRLIEDYGPRNLDLHEALYREFNKLREWQTDNITKVSYPDVLLGVPREDDDRPSRRDDRQPDRG